jgi:hypothetical protein
MAGIMHEGVLACTIPPFGKAFAAVASQLWYTLALVFAKAGNQS